MITINDHHTKRLFDPWAYLGPKRRKLLEKSWAGLFREHLFNKIPVNKIVCYFDKYMGRPTKELFTAIGAVILQQVHDLSDEETITSVAFNTQWHYSLDITGESDEAKYLCEKTLRSFRKIIIKNNLEGYIFEDMTDKLLGVFNVDTSIQRLDSGHIFSNMRDLRRLEIFTNTIEKFLRKMKNTYKNLLDTLIDPELKDRYLSKKSSGCFAKVKPSKASKTLQQAGEDLLYLVELFSTNREVKKLHAYRLLKRVLSEQCNLTGKGKNKKLQIKQAKEVSADSLQNPSDPDATYDGHKGKGYQVQIMETYQPYGEGEKRDKSKPNLITHVSVEQAHEHDSNALQPALDNTKSRGCCPEEVQCDTAYGSDENVQEAKEKGVDVIAPVCGPSESPATKMKDFEFDETTKLIKCCPEGHKPIKVKRTKSNRMTARFSKKHCRVCKHLENCPVTVLKKGDYSLRYNEKHYRLAKRRTFEDTPEFLDKYRWRAGAEGTQSHYKNDLGAGRLRVRGMAQVRFAATLKALGLNILRAAKAYRYDYNLLFELFFGHLLFQMACEKKSGLDNNLNNPFYLILCQRTIIGNNL